MLLPFCILFAIALAQAIPGNLVPKCSHYLGAYHAAGGMPRGNQMEEMVARPLRDVTTAAVTEAAQDPSFIIEAGDMFGPRFKIYVFGFCTVNPGWTVFSCKTSDQEAVLRVEPPVSSGMEGDGSSLVEYMLSLQAPNNSTQWLLELEVAEGPGLMFQTTSPSEQSLLNVFPSFEPALSLYRNGVGPQPPANFPDGYVCLLELSASPNLFQDTLQESVCTMEAMFPVQPQSVWMMAGDKSRIDPPSPAGEKVTRYYAKTTPGALVHFNPFTLGISTHLLAYVNGRSA